MAGGRVRVLQGRNSFGEDIAGQAGWIRVLSRADSAVTLDDGSIALCLNRHLMPDG